MRPAISLVNCRRRPRLQLMPIQFLAANFSPDDRVWMRLLDLGIDSFFAQPNDLVVPTAGGWHIDKGVNSYVPPERIGCFGAGGNLADSVPVHQLNFFQQPDSAAFI